MIISTKNICNFLTIALSVPTLSYGKISKDEYDLFSKNIQKVELSDKAALRLLKVLEDNDKIIFDQESGTFEVKQSIFDLFEKENRLDLSTSLNATDCRIGGG